MEGETAVQTRSLSAYELSKWYLSSSSGAVGVLPGLFPQPRHRAVLPHVTHLADTCPQSKQRDCLL
jgi:hypothetical protein